MNANPSELSRGGATPYNSCALGSDVSSTAPTSTLNSERTNSPDAAMLGLIHSNPVEAGIAGVPRQRFQQSGYKAVPNDPSGSDLEPSAAESGDGLGVKLAALFERALSGVLPPGVPIRSDSLTVNPSEVNLSVMDEATLRFVVAGLVSGNRQIQRYITDNYMTDDVRFIHFMGSAQGREQLYNIYRCATFWFTYKIEFRDIVLTSNKAVVWVDLKIKPIVSWPGSGRKTFPCLVLLHFDTCSDGRVRINLQMDHHSLYFLNYMGGAAAMQVSETLIRPLMGAYLVAAGGAIDFFEARRASLYKYMGWLETSDDSWTCTTDSCVKDACAPVLLKKVVEDYEPVTMTNLGTAWSLIRGIPSMFLTIAFLAIGNILAV